MDTEEESTCVALGMLREVIVLEESQLEDCNGGESGKV